MKICGIIAEYNPFHDGHAYQIREAKKISGADAVVVAMSGHFVQRGEPAIYDPYLRAGCALVAGADAVFMLPPEASTSSAEGFAAYGVKLLDALGCDSISCGVEEGFIPEVLPHYLETPEVSEKIKAGLKEGLSYPAAWSNALGIEKIGPNSILALQYLKAIRGTDSKMEFYPVERKGSAYDDTEIHEGEYPSASAVRKTLFESGSTGIIGPDDVMPMIVEAVRAHESELESYLDCSTEIAQRIRGRRLYYETFEEMVTDLKTKDVTYTRIARVLTHILLGIRKPAGEPMAAQLIGFKDNGTLGELKERTSVKIISKAANYQDRLESSARAAEIYNQAYWNKYHEEKTDFYKQNIVKC